MDEISKGVASISSLEYFTNSKSKSGDMRGNMSIWKREDSTLDGNMQKGLHRMYGGIDRDFNILILIDNTREVVVVKIILLITRKQGKRAFSESKSRHCFVA